MDTFIRPILDVEFCGSCDLKVFVCFSPKFVVNHIPSKRKNGTYFPSVQRKQIRDNTQRL